MRFSIQQLLMGICVFVFAMASGTVYYNWSRGVIDQQFLQYRALQKLSMIKNGDQFSDVQTLFPGLFEIDGPMKETVIAGMPEALPDDELFGIPIDSGHARFVYFRDDRLVNHKFEASDFLNTVAVLKLTTPPWHLRHGHLVVAIGVLIVGLSIIALLSFLARRRHSAA